MQNDSSHQKKANRQIGVWNMSDELEFGLDLYTLEDEDGVESTFEKIDELEYEVNRYVAFITYYE